MGPDQHLFILGFDNGHDPVMRTNRQRDPSPSELGQGLTPGRVQRDLQKTNDIDHLHELGIQGLLLV